MLKKINGFHIFVCAMALTALMLTLWAKGSAVTNSWDKMTQFELHPQNFKGQTLVATVQFVGGGTLPDHMQSWHAFGSDSYRGKFKAWTRDGYLSLELDLPYDMVESVPVVTRKDKMWVTFTCTEGRHESGNIVRQLSRQ